MTKKRAGTAEVLTLPDGSLFDTPLPYVELDLPLPSLGFSEELPMMEKGTKTARKSSKRKQKKATTAAKAVTDYGRAHIWEWMECLSKYAAKQKRTVFAYVDAAISFASFQPLDPDGVAFLRKSVPDGTPWGFFIGGQGCPEKLTKADSENVAEALGNLFPAAALSAAAEVAAQRKGRKPGKAAEV